MNINRRLYQSIASLAFLTGFILMLPWIAMQFSDKVVWILGDFIIMGILIFGTGLTYKLITRKTDDITYRVALGFALLTGFFLIWTNLAVGLIGSEDNDINLMYFGVIGVGIISAFLARFQSQGMAFTMFAIAFTQALVTVIALLAGSQYLPGSSVVEILAVNGFFILLWSIPALLFRHAAQKQSLST